MKKALALALAAIIFASVLTSCASLEQRTSQQTSQRSALDPKITVTSSDALDAAEWLDDRLETIPDRVVIGTDAAEYGVDVSALEDDGYFIRNFDGEVALFARTEDGLDRAARKYAKAVEAGAAIADETYHEGYRIGAIELAGRDISEYTIYCEDDKYMPAAANELSARIARACGASLPVVTGEKTAPYISLVYTRDDSLSTVGYRWEVDEDGLTIECSDGYKPTAARCAVARFLENELDWFGLSYGFETLAEADSVSIPAGKSGGEVNAFLHYSPYGDSTTGDVFDHSAMTLSGVPNCCHGLQNNHFASELSKSPGGDWANDQPCYMSDEFFEVSYDDISAYIEKKLEDGQHIGEDFCFVDIAAGDNAKWCRCKDCIAILRAEEAQSASIVDWANRLSSALDEKYKGLTYGIFAYLGTNKPPKTIVPNKNVSVTFCYNSYCDMHTHDGKDCEADYQILYLEDWLAITKNVYVWYYGMDEGFMTISYTGTVREDMRYFRNVGIKGVMWEAEDNGFSTGKISKWLAAGLVWDIDMTDEEYDEYFNRILAAMYGDAAPYVREYCDAVALIQRSAKCAPSGYTAAATPTFAPTLIAAQFDTLFELTEAALRNVDSRREEKRMTKLSAACIYQGCAASYFDAYAAGDGERIDELSRRYSLIETRLAAFGMNVRSCWQGGIVVWDREDYQSDMEDMAWTSWKKNAKLLSLDVPDKTDD